MSLVSYIRNFFVVAGDEAVTRIAEWVKEKFYTKSEVYTKEEIDAMLSAGVTYLVVDSLPSTGVNGTIYLVPKQNAETGDVYDEYIWLPTRGLVSAHFEHIGSTDVDLSDYYTKTEADNLLDDKVDKVNGKGLSTNDYTTTEKNKLSSIENGAEVNVQSDWNQTDTSADDFIKNKPSVYTKSETDNLLDDKVDKVSGKGLSTEDYTTAEKTKLGGIESGAEVNVQSDWNQSDSTKDDYIKNKPTLRQPSADGTAGQYLKSNGSGNAPSWETMDTAPTDNSTKAVTSGGVKTALDGKQASISINTNANTPTDNDTVIMQDSGNTGTTSFLRRKLSTLWEYFKGKDGYPEARLAWGGKHLTNATSPVDAALIPDLSANRAAFINPNCVDILYSEDGGTTWQDYGLTDWDKQRLLCDERSVIVGKRSSSQHADAQCMLRILIHDTTSYFYAKIQKIAVYCATNGSEGCYCNVTGRKQVDINNNVDSWDTLADHVGMSGWSGWNIIQTSFITYGGNTTAFHINNYYGQIRLDFGISGPTTADNGTGLSISRIRMYGTECWGGSMSYLAKYGNPFVLREGKKCVFEGPIAVKDGTANQVLLANGDVMGLPVPINKGGTGATTAIGAEYNILNQVADISTTLSDTRKIALCNQTKSASNGVFRWIALSNVWTWIKTHFDSSPTSGSSNGITSGGVYSALEEKVNLQPDFTASQIDYSAGNVGKWQKVLRFPEGADLVINMKKTAMGSDSTSTLWFSSSSMGDSYTSLFGNHSVRFVHDGGYVFLVLACRKSTNEPIESYTFQIAHSSVPMSDIVAVTEASPITATPKEPNIVYRAPMTTGAVSFNVTSGAGSVYMSGHNDFLGNMTSEATNGVTVTMSGATEGQIYRFVFTRNITGGVTFKQSNVAYCTISGDVNAGDTITLTAVSNTADGWLYEQESAGIESSDGSNIIEYNGSTADVRVNWDKLPANVVRNGAYSSSTGHENIAIGFASSVAPTSYSGAVAIGKSTTSRGNFSIVVGCFSNADNGGMAFGTQAHANGSSSLAVGSNVTANDSDSIAIGYQTEAGGFQAIAIGPYASTKNINALALGYNAKANQLRGGYDKHELVQFKVNGESKKVYTSSTAETISIEITGIGTFAGIDMYANYMLFVLNEELEFANELLFEVDGIVKQKQDFSSSAWNYISVSRMTALGSSGYYAYTFPSRYIDYSDINTSANAYFFATSGDSYNNRYSGISIGNSSVSIGSGNIAIGDGATSIKDGQVVIGRFNAESGTDLMQVGNGTETNRKNILTIDSNERLKVCSYVGETQTIDMNQQTGSIGNITKSIYRIRWNDTGTVNLTLDTGGCVEGQRVTIFAETNDVQIRFTSYLIPEGQFADFMFIAGAWRPYSGIGRVPTA